MTAPARRLAPAKVNLGLRVVGLRDDGYHLLESLFVPLDLVDRVRVSVEPSPRVEIGLRLTGATADLPAGDENLAARAARAFLEATGRTARVEIELDKRIPIGAGLGGGSSDAAAVLRALAAIFANAIAEQELAALALRLGADVPFFLDPRPAWVTGIGERIEPIDDVAPLDLVLVTPVPPLSTAEVFRTYDAALTPAGPSRRIGALRGSPGRTLTATLSREEEGQVEDGSREDLALLLANDLEPVATRLCPAISRVRSELEKLGAQAVAMSGSGPTVFGLFGSSEQARAAQMRGRFHATDRVLVARTLGAPGTGQEGDSSWGVV